MSEFYVRRDPSSGLRHRLKATIPPQFHMALRPLGRLIMWAWNLPPNVFFVVRPPQLRGLSYPARVKAAYAMDRISRHVHCAHKEQEIVTVWNLVLELGRSVPGAIVEAGCFKGGSTAKWSNLAALSGRRVHAFDSFEGIPENAEAHEVDIWGQDLRGAFARGAYRGGEHEVRKNVQKYGRIDLCTFHKGWFDETMPKFREPVCVAYIDVDLASSTKTCVKYLYPLLVPGGALVSQDGHIPLVVDALSDDHFWESEVGCPRPPMEGLGTSKLVIIRKP